jgi:hypothetical protein
MMTIDKEQQMICDECETVAHCLKNGCVPKQPPSKDEALELALDALETLVNGNGFAPAGNIEKARKAITAIKQALAAPVQPAADAEGENMAVRSFLMFYGQCGGTVGEMKRHMGMGGFKSWPAWVDTDPEGAHLTKAGAQLWIRHLFALEAIQPTGEKQ